MGKKRHFTQKQQLDILESAKDVGIKKAAGLGAVHYLTVYQWQRRLKVLRNGSSPTKLEKNRFPYKWQGHGTIDENHFDSSTSLE